MTLKSAASDRNNCKTISIRQVSHLKSGHGRYCINQPHIAHHAPLGPLASHNRGQYFGARAKNLKLRLLNQPLWSKRNLSPIALIWVKGILDNKKGAILNPSSISILSTLSTLAEKNQGLCLKDYQMSLCHLDSPTGTPLYACGLVGANILACCHASSSCSTVCWPSELSPLAAALEAQLLWHDGAQVQF